MRVDFAKIAHVKQNPEFAGAPAFIRSQMNEANYVLLENREQHRGAALAESLQVCDRTAGRENRRRR